MMEEIRDGYTNQLLAIIISRRFCMPVGSTKFFTDNAASMQLGYFRHSAGHVIEPHRHTPAVRSIYDTQEMLLVRRGRLRVDLYNAENKVTDIRTLEAGDIILLVKGGHGFVCEDDTEILEIKQGPYLGEQDKTRFNPATSVPGESQCP
jgi:hypothetical protein